jgi:hypothetical protein
MMFADASSVAKKGSAFRRYFHELGWRRAARLRSGFAQDALPSMVSLPYWVFGLAHLTMCGSTVV